MGENYMMNSFVNINLHEKLLGKSNDEGWDWTVMQKVWENKFIQYFGGELKSRERKNTWKT
jgi:hypothetical protein